jgi:hypothetical protein
MVHKKEIGGQTDIQFSFLDKNLPEKKDDGTDLPADVLDRRRRTERTTVYAKLKINNYYVSETKRVRL